MINNDDKVAYLEEVIAVLMKRMGLSSLTIPGKELDELGGFSLLVEEGDDYSVHILPDYVSLEEKEEVVTPAHGLTDEKLAELLKDKWHPIYSWPISQWSDTTLEYKVSSDGSLYATPIKPSSP